MRVSPRLSQEGHSRQKIPRGQLFPAWHPLCFYPAMQNTAKKILIVDNNDSLSRIAWGIYQRFRLRSLRSRYGSRGYRSGFEHTPQSNHDGSEFTWNEWR